MATTAPEVSPPNFSRHFDAIRRRLIQPQQGTITDVLTGRRQNLTGAEQAKLMSFDPTQLVEELVAAALRVKDEEAIREKTPTIVCQWTDQPDKRKLLFDTFASIPASRWAQDQAEQTLPRVFSWIFTPSEFLQFIDDDQTNLVAYASRVIPAFRLRVGYIDRETAPSTKYETDQIYTKLLPFTEIAQPVIQADTAEIVYRLTNSRQDDRLPLSFLRCGLKLSYQSFLAKRALGELVKRLSHGPGGQIAQETAASLTSWIEQEEVKEANSCFWGNLADLLAEAKFPTASYFSPLTLRLIKKDEQPDIPIAAAICRGANAILTSPHNKDWQPEPLTKLQLMRAVWPMILLVQKELHQKSPHSSVGSYFLAMRIFVENLLKQE